MYAVREFEMWGISDSIPVPLSYWSFDDTYADLTGHNDWTFDVLGLTPPSFADGGQANTPKHLTFRTDLQFPSYLEQNGTNPSLRFDVGKNFTLAMWIRADAGSIGTKGKFCRLFVCFNLHLAVVLRHR